MGRAVEVALPRGHWFELRLHDEAAHLDDVVGFQEVRGDSHARKRVGRRAVHSPPLAPPGGGRLIEVTLSVKPMISALSPGRWARRS